MKYLVIEIQTSAQGVVSNLVSSYDSKAIAEQQYFLTLSAAAVSSVPVHAVMLISNTGSTLETRFYTHTPETVNEA